MKIAVWHNLPSGGAKRALWHHVRGLVERGHRVEVWCPASADREFMPLSEFCPEHVLPMPRRAGRRMPSVLSRARDIRNRNAVLAEHCAACAEEINKSGCDVLFANSSMSMAVAGIGRLSTLPSVLYLQEPNRSLYEAWPTLRWAALPPPAKGRWWAPGYAKWWIEDALTLMVLRETVRDERANAVGYGRILVNSIFSRESVMRAYGLDAWFCPLGVDTGIFRPTGCQREGFVLGLGQVHHGKGIDRAIRALAAIPEDARPELVWVGNRSWPDCQAECSALAEKTNVKVTFRIGIPEAEVVDCLNRAALLLYTSRLEPFGFAALEAAACETPVVGIAEGGLRETIQHERTGLLVANEDPALLGAAVRRLLEQPELARRLGCAGRAYVEQAWTWAHAVTALERHLNDVCRQGGGGQ